MEVTLEPASQAGLQSSVLTLCVSGNLANAIFVTFFGS